MISVISDTHGLVRPEVFDILKGFGLIIHAGDISSADVLNALEPFAPVMAVRGNIDRDSWADHIPHDQVIEFGSHLFYGLHELDHLDLEPAAADISAVIYGHSHCPLVERKKGVLYLNPESAGPSRSLYPLPLPSSKSPKRVLFRKLLSFNTGGH